MSDALDVLTIARRQLHADPGPQACWNLVVQAIETGWLDEEELGDLVVHLQAKRDFGVEELLFAHVGDELRVSFLDDRASCSPASMLAALHGLLPRPHDG